MKRKVLVVDDDEAIRVLVGHLLRSEGYDVMLAQDGASAMVTARHQDPDAIVLDIGMPAGDGLTVLRRMRQAGSGTPVVVLTGRSGEEIRKAALEAGASDFLTKPVDRDRLLAALQDQIQASIPKAEAVRCPQCGWAVPLASLDTEVLEAAAEELRARRSRSAGRAQ